MNETTPKMEKGGPTSTRHECCVSSSVQLTWDPLESAPGNEPLMLKLIEMVGVQLPFGDFSALGRICFFKEIQRMPYTRLMI